MPDIEHGVCAHCGKPYDDVGARCFCNPARSRMPVSEPSYDDLTPTGAMGGLCAIASQCPGHGAFIHAVCTGPLAEVERLRAQVDRARLFLDGLAHLRCEDDCEGFRDPCAACVVHETRRILGSAP